MRSQGKVGGLRTRNPLTLSESGYKEATAGQSPGEVENGFEITVEAI